MTVPASQLDYSQMQDSAGKACGLLKAMANEARMMVLCQLIEGEKSVTELQDAVGLSQTAMSQHLAVLREQGIAEDIWDREAAGITVKRAR